MMPQHPDGRRTARPRPRSADASRDANGSSRPREGALASPEPNGNASHDANGSTLTVERTFASLERAQSAAHDGPRRVRVTSARTRTPPMTQTDPRGHTNARIRHRNRARPLPVTQTAPCSRANIRLRHRSAVPLMTTRRLGGRRNARPRHLSENANPSRDENGSSRQHERTYPSPEPSTDASRDENGSRLTSKSTFASREREWGGSGSRIRPDSRAYAPQPACWPPTRSASIFSW